MSDNVRQMITEMQQRLIAKEAETARSNALNPSSDPTAPAENQGVTPAVQPNRRRMLKKLAIGMAGVGAAGVALAGGTQTTFAATGTLPAGGFYAHAGSGTATNFPTALTGIAGSENNDFAGDIVDPFTAGTTGVCHTDLGAGVGGLSLAEGGGVIGLALAPGKGVGGIFYGGRAQLKLEPDFTAGAPTTGAHYVGDIYLDTNANLYLCLADGTPGTWRKIVGSTTAGALHVLPSPDRYVDTRSFVATGDTLGIITAGTSRSFKIINTPGQNSVTLPTGVTAVTGNLAVVPVSSTVGGGFLKIYADGATTPPTANINFTPTGGALNNAFISAVSSIGNIRVFASKDAHVIVDVTGYYL